MEEVRYATGCCAVVTIIENARFYLKCIGQQADGMLTEARTWFRCTWDRPVWSRGSSASHALKTPAPLQRAGASCEGGV